MYDMNPPPPPICPLYVMLELALALVDKAIFYTINAALSKVFVVCVHNLSEWAQQIGSVLVRH